METKYHSSQVIFNGECFDSRKEARRYGELMLLYRAGKITGLQRQVKYVLIPAQYEGAGRHRKCIERECAYLADFVYVEDGKTIVEDTKGVRTKDYIIKRKLMLFVHGIKILEV